MDRRKKHKFYEVKKSSAQEVSCVGLFVVLCDVWSVCAKVIECVFGEVDIYIVRNVKVFAGISEHIMKAEGECGYEYLCNEWNKN